MLLVNEALFLIDEAMLLMMIVDNSMMFMMVTGWCNITGWNIVIGWSNDDNW